MVGKAKAASVLATELLNLRRVRLTGLLILVVSLMTLAATLGVESSARSAPTRSGNTPPPTSVTLPDAAPNVVIPGGPAPGLDGFNSVSCWSYTDCVVLEKNSLGTSLLFSSSDGGASWMASSLPANTPELYASTCVSSSQCLAVGTGSRSVLTRRRYDLAGIYRSSRQRHFGLCLLSESEFVHSCRSTTWCRECGGISRKLN